MNIKKMVLLSLFFCAIAKAQVNPENGNFYISYHSAEQVKNDHALALVRTYNSLSPGKGWYGWGWGSPFETKLIVMPDHSAAILENGAGMVHYYHASSEDVLKGVNIIVDVVQKKDDLTNGTAEQLRGRLLRDEDFRVEMVEKFDIHAELPINASLSLNGEPLLRRIESGYDRKSSTSDEVDLFDLQGNLIEIRHDDGYDVKLDYADNKPILLHDSEGQSIKLVWSDDGHLIAAGKLDDVTESYAYDEQGELARVSDRSGNVYRYEYDQYHSMTKISYIDGSFKAIQYANDAPGRAIEVTERNGDKMLYAYSVDRSDPERTSTVETQASKDGVKTTSEYRFTHKTADNGEHILSKYSSDRNKDLDDRTYDEKGRVTSKLTASGDTIYYFYAPQTNKFRNCSAAGRLYGIAGKSTP
jgi:YD repeat-containing protein